MSKNFFELISSEDSFKQFLKLVFKECIDELPLKPEPGKEKKNYMTVAQVSKYINLSPPAIYKRIHENTIPHKRLGRKIIFDAEIIDAWIEREYGTSGTAFLLAVYGKIDLWNVVDINIIERKKQR
jgi:excisionase family DNA binding protein